MINLSNIISYGRGTLPNLIEESAEDELKDIRNGALFDLEKEKNFNDLLEAYENEKKENSDFF